MCIWKIRFVSIFSCPNKGFYYSGRDNCPILSVRTKIRSRGPDRTGEKTVNLLFF